MIILIIFYIYRILFFTNDSCDNKWTYSLTFAIFVLIIGIILSFNIINTINYKTIFKLILYCLIILFILFLDLLRSNIKCIGAVKNQSNPDEKPIYFFNNSKQYNRVIFILIIINIIFYDNILVYKNDSENKSKFFEKLKEFYNQLKEMNMKSLPELINIFKNNFEKFNFENFNYLFIFMFLLTYIPNFIPNIQSVFNLIISFIIFLFYLSYTINNFFDIPSIFKKLFKFSDILKTNQFFLCLIIIFIILILFFKNNFMDTSTEDNPYVDLSKFNNFIYFTIIMFCFLILFLLKNNLFSNPLDKITKFIGLYWHIFLVVFIILFILSFVYYMIKYHLRALDFTKCTKDNIKQYLMLIIYNDDYYEDFKDDLCKYFNVKNRTQLANKVDSLNFDEDGCFNYEDLKPIFDKIKSKNIFTQNENNYVSRMLFCMIIILILIPIIIVCIALYLGQIEILPIIYNYWALILIYVVIIIILCVIYYFTNSITLYDSCEDNKIQCEDKLNREKCSGVVEDQDISWYDFITTDYSGQSCKNAYHKVKDSNWNLWNNRAENNANDWCNTTSGCTLNRVGCEDKYYKMNFNKTIHSRILWGLLFSLIIIICMFYQNILNTRLLLEKNKIFIIIFVIIIIICSFLLLQNNIIQN